MLKLVTHSISTKTKVPTLSEYVKTAQTRSAMASSPAVTKTASAAVCTKKATSTGEFELKFAKEAFPGAAPLFKSKKNKNKGKKDDSVEVEVEVDEPKTKEASVEVECEGESSGQLEPSKNPQNDPNKDPKVKGNKGSKGTKGGESDEGESSGQLDSAKNPQNDPKVEGEKKKAKNYQWFKTANLTGEQKADVRKTLEKFWPKKFVDALLADR